MARGVVAGWRSGFVQVLASLAAAPGVSAHSSIPVLDGRPLAEEKDGVVASPSAYIEPVDSELVVRHSGQSTQGNPGTMGEAHRILREHAGRVFQGSVCVPPAGAQ